MSSKKWFKNKTLDEQICGEMYVYMMSSLMFIKKPMKRKPRLLVLIDLHVETVTLYRILFGAADEGFSFSMTRKTNSAICLLNLSGSLNNSCFFLQYFNYDLNKKIFEILLQKM